MANVTWALGGGDGSGSWNVAANWSTDTVPQLGDIAFIGTNGISASFTVSATTLEDIGDLQIAGNAVDQATLSVSASAGFGGQPGSLGVSFITVTSKAAIVFASGQIADIPAFGVLTLDGASAFIADASSPTSNSALTGLATVEGELVLESGAAVKIAAGLANSGTINLDVETTGGGSKLIVTGTLTNNFDLSAGDASATTSALSTVQAAAIDNTSGGTIDLEDGAVASAGSLDNAGTIRVDAASAAGGSKLIVKGKLTNRSALEVNGDYSSPTVAVETAALDNAGGGIALTGSGTAPVLMDVVAAASLTGNIDISGDAVLEFASGQVTSIGAGDQLTLDGPSAFIADQGAITSDSALHGLKAVAGTFTLQNRARFTTAGNLVNNDAGRLPGTLQIEGGALTVKGTLTNAAFSFTGGGGLIEMSGATGDPGLLDIESAAGFGAPGSLIGEVVFTGGPAVIEFASGQITDIAKGGSLLLLSSSGFIADAGHTTSDSALKLSSIEGSLDLDIGETLTTPGALTLTGSIIINPSIGNFDSPTPAALNVGSAAGLGTAGVLSGDLLLTGDSASAAARIVFARGQIAEIAKNSLVDLSGPDAFIADAGAIASNSALRGLASVDGTLRLEGESIATNSGLGNAGEIDDSGTLSINGALTNTAQYVPGIDGSGGYGGIYVYVGGALTANALVNTGTIGVNSGSFTISGAVSNSGAGEIDVGESGSRLTVAGALTNSGVIHLGAANDPFAGDDTVTAKSFDNVQTSSSEGKIALYGDTADSERMLLDVTGGVAGFGSAGVLSGQVDLFQDSLIDFLGKGEISSIKGQLDLNGSDAFVADAGALTSNSALTGLMSVSGTLTLKNGAKIAATGNLRNTGTINVDPNRNERGSRLTVAGVLTNSGVIQLGAANGTLAGADTVKSASLVNNTGAQIYLYGGSSDFSLSTGAVSNAGSISVHDDAQTFNGAITGDGSMFLYNDSTLTLDSSVASGQTIEFNGADELALGSAKAFAAAIVDFGVGDSVEANGFGNGTTFNFSENAAHTSGGLTLTHGAAVAHLDFTGDYLKSDFSLINSATTSLIKFL